VSRFARGGGAPVDWFVGTQGQYFNVLTMALLFDAGA
jgi:hypothetical protein